MAQLPGTSISATFAILFLGLPLSGQAEPPSFDHSAEATWKQISWDDFQGRGTTDRRRDATPAARIVTQIRVPPFRISTEEVDGQIVARAPEIEAYAVMDKLLSRVEIAAREDSVLAHEQLHFDLTEALARHLRVELRTISSTGPTEEEAVRALEFKVRNLVGSRNREMEDLQRSYDEETRHGTKKRAQKDWAERIAERLAEVPPPVD